MGPRGYQPADPIEVTDPGSEEVVASAREAMARALTDRDGTDQRRPSGEDVRRDQLTRWHHDDHPTDPGYEHGRNDDEGRDRRCGHDDGAGA